MECPLVLPVSLPELDLIHMHRVYQRNECISTIGPIRPSIPPGIPQPHRPRQPNFPPMSRLNPDRFTPPDFHDLY